MCILFTIQNSLFPKKIDCQITLFLAYSDTQTSGPLSGTSDKSWKLLVSGHAAVDLVLCPHIKCSVAALESWLADTSAPIH